MNFSDIFKSLEKFDLGDNLESQESIESKRLTFLKENIKKAINPNPIAIRLILLEFQIPKNNYQALKIMFFRDKEVDSSFLSIIAEHHDEVPLLDLVNLARDEIKNVKASDLIEVLFHLEEEKQRWSAFIGLNGKVETATRSECDQIISYFKDDQILYQLRKFRKFHEPRKSEVTEELKTIIKTDSEGNIEILNVGSGGTVFESRNTVFKGNINITNVNTKK